MNIENFTPAFYHNSDSGYGSGRNYRLQQSGSVGKRLTDQWINVLRILRDYSMLHF